MTRRVTSVAAPVAHLVGPGKLNVVNGRLAFSTGKAAPLRLDPNTLRTVFCYGPVGLSDEALRVLFHHNVEVAWLTAAGQRCRGRLVRSDPSSTALRLQQYQVLMDPKFKLRLARDVVVKKISSQIAAARHYQRHGHPQTRGIVRKLSRLRNQASRAGEVESLRGIEGAASNAWFQFLGKLLRPPWTFARRARRPPADPVNALLSLGYTLLTNRMVARCQAFGLEVTLGALHEFRPGRPSLACDLVEPLRVPAVDRWVVKLCNQNRVRLEDFQAERGGVRLEPKILPRVLADWETEWYKQAHEQLMEDAVARLVAEFRRHCEVLPTLTGGGEERGGVGKNVTHDAART